ncbi:3'(2'),5'-bisphosphate nucleotidase CysQ [Lichenihabitans sp. PAMC28606]|uniref:inositol monophosphatase family protein n=1 Tax=Lichenihabitans sp. PAMC28606 TaxID=2880932 RepID=UPI001D0B302A|nr:3'(2'),5'-bisphosphate nucleotidase CysQ [Lichenihabitans sp. PAMC28606]UDL94832.1 3'(2'),5'-bisphosphate nucleotidase CysQ [Lichenihabitans sp. PAMC28606]
MAHVSTSDLDGTLTLFRDAAIGASEIACRYFRPGARTSARIDYKDGGSPVTEADFAVDAYLRERLTEAMPGAAWMSEETVDSAERLERDHVLIVDPIDGTRGFAAGDARWAVSIALVTKGRPTVGIVHAPILDQSFTAILGRGAACNGVAIHPSSRLSLDGACIAVPGDLANHLPQPLAFRVSPKIPSLACRFAHVAAGFLDGCIAGANAHDWDIAAADLILIEAGAQLTDRHGQGPVYNRRSPRHPMLICAAPLLQQALIRLLQRPED